MTSGAHSAGDNDFISSKQCAELAREFELPLQLANLLHKRGITTVKDAKRFLFPDFKALPGPDQFKGMAEAVKVILDACTNDVPLLVHGDYDVDGITGTVLLVRFLRLINPEVRYHIPNRLKDEYGLSKASVDQAAELMPGKGGVLITVDCGITSREAVQYASSLGYQVVITDHHQPPEFLPDAPAVLNPKQPGCGFPFKELSGVGVAFFLVAALRRELINRGFWGNSERAAPNLKQYLDLVCLGTVADVMPLVDVNRILVRGGLEVLNTNRRTGLSALANCCGIHGRDKITPETISFTLAPRINAAGRMGEVDHAVKLLLTDDHQEAQLAAQTLETLNAKRRKLEQDILEQVFTCCSKEIDLGKKAVAIFHEDCHAGILGIIASRIADKFGVPAIVLTVDRNIEQEERTLKGSGRSIEGVNLYEKLSTCKKHIKQFGGHSMAVGLTVSEENLERFQQQFDLSCKDEPAATLNASPQIDLHIRDKHFLDNWFLAKMQFLEPFGEGNPEPLFFLEAEQLMDLKTVKDHLTFTMSTHNGARVSGIGFFMADKAAIAKEGPVDIAFKFKCAYFRGTRRLEVQAVDLKQSSTQNLT